MEKHLQFPVYRKYAHNRTFFKITSGSEFEELQIIGHTYFVHHIKAKILPDRNFINDMLYAYEKNWVAIDAQEYDNKMEQCGREMKRM